jgi:hypothetical protein
MRAIIFLLGFMCFVANLRVGNRLANAMVFGGDTISLWILFFLFMAGTAGCVFGFFLIKK